MSSKLLNYPAASSNPHNLVTGSSGSAAGSRNTGHSSAQLNFENLQLDDILCTVCQSVLVEPVFLPCQHRFCRNCLSGTIEKNNLNCPCCRKRFGTWYRNASRVNKLVHEQLWSAIQSQFRDYLEEDGPRCNGNGSVGNCFVPQSESVIHISEPGEIRKEYESELQRYRKELIEEKKKELAASEKYIINLYKQEGIIDLVDSSDHLSISSSTSTPEPDSKQNQPQQRDNDVQEVEDDEEAGPSGSSFPQPMAVSNNQKGTQQSTNVVSSTSNVTTSRPATSKSLSNGSVISISSTSSASAASSSCISSASSRYSLIKSVAQQIGRGTDMIKQKVQNSLLHKQVLGGVAKKTFTMADLNKSELCVKPTKLHRRTSSQAGNDDDDVDDGDSLRSELNHFKPIIATTPKSCFSPKAIVRVPSVRPETVPLPRIASAECLSPSKSPFKPIDPTTPRRSAFSVVNIHLFTPPTLSLEVNRQKQQETAAKKSNPPSGSSSASSSAKKKKKLNVKKTIETPSINRRKRKLKFSPQPKAKVKLSPKKETTAKPKVNTPKPRRITRRSFNQEAVRLKELIVNDQQRRAEMIEQERRDFEFAQKLQKKLNRTRGSISTALTVEPFSKNVPMVRRLNNAYSLRRKTFATVQPVSRPAVEPGSTSLASEAPCRKRKTMAPPAPVETKESQSQQPKVKKVKLQTPIVPRELEAATSILRRSTRNRT